MENAGSKVNILNKILQQKKQEIRYRSENRKLQQLIVEVESAPQPRDFMQAIKDKIQNDGIAVIAEVKKASPSKGVLRPDFDPVLIAKDYALHGASCLSVLTDEKFFQGSLDYLNVVRQACSIPLLRKDFIIDPYQIYEARVAGADCVLLIVAALDDALLHGLTTLAMDLGMAVLIEVHNKQEMERALQTPAKLLGVNNRDLHSFETRIETSIQLKPMIPKDRILVSESGIHQRKQVAILRAQDIQVFLVGEAFMRARSPGIALKQLFY